MTASSTRPTTPYYFYNHQMSSINGVGGDANSNDNDSDPPPSYSSDSSPSSVSSPRSSTGEPAQEAVIDLRRDLVQEGQRRASNGANTTASTASSLGFHSRSSLSASNSVIDDADYGLLSDSEFGGSNASGSANGTMALANTSSVAHPSARSLHMRFGSPAPNNNAILPSGSPALDCKSSSDRDATASTSASSTSLQDVHHHHIHHHFHHGTRSSSASSAALATTSSTSSQYTPPGPAGHPLAPAGLSSASSSGIGLASADNSILRGKGKGKENDTIINGFTSRRSSTHSACASADYAVPSDFYASHHYRAGPLARKLGSAILSRDPSLTDLPLLHSVSSSSSLHALNPSGNSFHSSRKRRTGVRRKVSDAVGDEDWATMLDTSTSLRSKRRFSALFPVPPTVVKAWQRFLRHPFVPTQPLTILFALSLFGCFAYSLTTFIYHILSTDKSPRPWRTYCQEQAPFPHQLADSLDPVDVFVGVFSVDAAYERRHMIRSTYGRQTKPIDPVTGQRAHNVQVKFILGRPRKHHARRIALEMETYNDVVVLDIKENMNQGKTHAFFKWANENATVPVYYRPPNSGKKIGSLDPVVNRDEQQLDTLNMGFKKADYVVKADDDSFLVLSELERHLRVAPRQATYWGYLIRNLFMGGECYALSADLVNYVATYPALEAYTRGAEDKRVAKWIRMHPNASSINWVTERCYVYDHPKAGTTYSHGFLFPDEVERVRLEGKTGISAAEKQRRGGDVLAEAWSSVTRWKKPYSKPTKVDMTMEEEVEALIEGGGRWSALDGYINTLSEKDLVKYEAVVFESQDERIRGKKDSAKRADLARAEHYTKATTAFGKYNRMPNSLLRDPGQSDIRPQHAKRSVVGVDESDGSESGGVVARPEAGSSSSAADTAADGPAADAQQDPNPIGATRQGDTQYPIGSSPNFKQGYSFLPEAPPNPDSYKTKAIPAPTPRYDASSMSLRERRFLGLPYGGTVVVHYLKRNEWFLETALALLGREKMWDGGHEAHLPYIAQSSSSGSSGKQVVHQPPSGDDHSNKDSAQEKDTRLSPVPTWNGKGEIDLVHSQWGGARIYGSPIIKENGFVSLGRTVPWDALEKTDDAKYGKLKGSPRQRYADPLHPIEGSSSSGSSQDSSTSSSSDSDRLSSSSLSSATHSTPDSDPSKGDSDVVPTLSSSLHDHTLSTSFSSLMASSEEAASHRHNPTERAIDSDTSPSYSQSSLIEQMTRSSGGIHFQDPNEQFLQA